MVSVLEEKFIRPTRPFSKKELEYHRVTFQKRVRLGNVRAFHRQCNHFYRVKEHSRKEKDITEKNTYIGKCSVCYSLSKTPEYLKKIALSLIDAYMENFLEPVPTSKFTYNLLDIEKCFYTWLYLEKHE